MDKEPSRRDEVAVELRDDLVTMALEEATQQGVSIQEVVHGWIDWAWEKRRKQKNDKTDGE